MEPNIHHIQTDSQPEKNEDPDWESKHLSQEKKKLATYTRRPKLRQTHRWSASWIIPSQKVRTYVIHLFLNIPTTMEMKTYYANKKHLALLS